MKSERSPFNCSLLHLKEILEEPRDMERFGRGSFIVVTGLGRSDPIYPLRGRFLRNSEYKFPYFLKTFSRLYFSNAGTKTFNTI